MDYSGSIAIEPGNRSGKPCMRGLRVTVSDVLENLASGMTPAEIVPELPYRTHEDVYACLAFAADRQRKLEMASVCSFRLVKISPPRACLDLSTHCAHYSQLFSQGTQRMPEGKGLLIVYTGPGKGKTTCALGTAFRAVGQGMRVMMVQFIKGSWHYGELDAAKMLGDDKFEIRPMGRGFVKIGGAESDPEDVKMCAEAWEFGRAQIYSDKYDLVVLDEINYVIGYKMLDVEPVVEALRQRPERVHVICTGRSAHPKLVEAADLVTEMREVKHPYTKGILAQRGIDY
jgi:cob(I)alamin adenosyltransferase